MEAFAKGPKLIQLSKIRENFRLGLKDASTKYYHPYASNRPDRWFPAFLIYYYAAASTNGIMVGVVAKGKKKNTKKAKYSKIRRTTYRQADEYRSIKGARVVAVRDGCSSVIWGKAI
jgi:hypothetical protein